MEVPSSPASIITAPPEYRETAQRLGKLIAEAKTCHFALLHYDGISKSMVDWFWPADRDGKKIPPSDLEVHRDVYNFRYPCCLCADGGGRGAYVESVVYSWWNKDTKKVDWTVRCASDTCGYQLRIDMYFRLPTSATCQYPRREREISPVELQWTHREQTELLNRLNSSVGNGITYEYNQHETTSIRERTLGGPNDPACKASRRLKWNFESERQYEVYDTVLAIVARVPETLLMNEDSDMSN
ncbi:hypothetical protein F4604DRAFT_1683728 [Suillus subluteus]|nr:hypothetical protein F4604DRAFT_1683728 [Suillus subluteus]